MLNACYSQETLGRRLGELLKGSAVVICWNEEAFDNVCAYFATKFYAWLLRKAKRFGGNNGLAGLHLDAFRRCFETASANCRKMPRQMRMMAGGETPRSLVGCRVVSEEKIGDGDSTDGGGDEGAVVVPAAPFATPVLLPLDAASSSSARSTEATAPAPPGFWEWATTLVTLDQMSAQSLIGAISFRTAGERNTDTDANTESLTDTDRRTGLDLSGLVSECQQLDALLRIVDGKSEAWDHDRLAQRRQHERDHEDEGGGEEREGVTEVSFSVALECSFVELFPCGEASTARQTRVGLDMGQGLVDVLCEQLGLRVQSGAGGGGGEELGGSVGGCGGQEETLHGDETVSATTAAVELTMTIEPAATETAAATTSTRSEPRTVQLRPGPALQASPRIGGECPSASIEREPDGEVQERGERTIVANERGYSHKLNRRGFDSSTHTCWSNHTAEGAV